MGRILVTSQEMAELDRRTIHEVGVPGRVLMELAGREVVRAVQAQAPGAKRVGLVCGVGNNGGDGFVTARWLAQAGLAVDVLVVGSLDRLSPDARSAFAALQAFSAIAVMHWDATSPERLRQCEVIVDALLGVGVLGAVRGDAALAIVAINELGETRPVIAVDLPSGVGADDGRALGVAVLASHTVTFGFAKRGLFLHPGARLAGTVEVVDIGIPMHLAVASCRLLEAVDVPALIPTRAVDAHKGSCGTLVIAAGCASMPGAAVLATQGALRAGAGLVCWLGESDQVAALLPPEVVRGSRTTATAWVIGPGWGVSEGRRAELAALLSATDMPVCLDADGLNLVAQDPSLWTLLCDHTVVTPHPKELSRLTGKSVTEIQADRPKAALTLARERGCVVVLKGAGTVIAEPSGALWISGVGNPGLATAGTGDVLAGVIGAFLAQGLGLSEAARAGVLVHGLAADEAVRHTGQLAMTASDVVVALPGVLSRFGR